MRRAIVLATAALTLGMLGSPAIAVAPGDVPNAGAASLDRISGEDRFATAALTANRAYPNGADTVIVATGLNFPDALAASYLSGGATDAPVLLVAPGHIPDATLDAMGTLDPSEVIVLGGTQAVSRDVVDELRDLVGAGNVERIGGTTRVETAAMIAHRGGAIGTAPNLAPDGDGDLVTAIVTRSDAFPDALAAGPLARAGRHPILLAHTGELPQATIDVLTDADLGIEQVIISGGTAAVSADVEAQIANLDSIASVHRVSGPDRTATAVAFGELTRTVLGWDGSTIALARGDDFPDALTLAPLAVQLNASLFLSRTPATIEGETFAGIQDLCGVAQDVVISGGTAAITGDAAGEAKLATLCADHAFRISGDQEVPEAGDADAEGTGWLTVVDGTICTAYDVDGLEGAADASHIHEAPAGQAGDVVADLGAPDASGFNATCVDDAQLAQDIQATPSDYYVNIHTPAMPLGAARGQVDGTEDARVTLTGEAEIEQDADGNDTGPVDEPADGMGTVDLFYGDAELCYEISVSGLGSAVDLSLAGGFHIHEGTDTQNGPIAVALPQSQAATDYTFFDCVAVDQDVLDEIMATPSDYYLNLHTVDGADPDTPLNGELRGQLG